MDSYGFLLDVALILISTKLFGLITKRIEMPQVVGALLAGIILGPGMLGILHETEFMNQIAEIGVIVLTFHLQRYWNRGLSRSIMGMKNRL